MKRLILFVLLGLWLGTLYAQEYTVESVPNPITANAHHYVSNPDGILSESTVNTLNAKLDSLSLNNGAQVAVVVLNSIGFDVIDNFAWSLFDKWRIGKEKEDNGLLVLFVLDQKKVRFETGYGLEGVIPDAIAKRIQSTVMVPEFRNGNYDAGMLAGVNGIISAINKEPVSEETPAPAFNWNEVLPFALAGYILLALLTFLWTRSITSQTLRNNTLSTNLSRYKVIRENNNSVASMVGLYLPVILLGLILFFASSLYLIFLLPVPLTVLPSYLYGRSMMTRVRRAPIPCKACGSQMHILSEKEDDAHLHLSQKLEEELKAVDYDVFVCENCKEEAIFTLDKKSQYETCPKCSTKAFILDSKRMVVAPTYVHAGTERLTYKCKFCGYQENNNRNIPRLKRNNSGFFGGAVGGGMFSGGGGFGGGGGGSFGGGMSGGGGATSGW